METYIVLTHLENPFPDKPEMGYMLGLGIELALGFWKRFSSGFPAVSATNCWHPETRARAIDLLVSEQNLGWKSVPRVHLPLSKSVSLSHGNQVPTLAVGLR